MPLQEFCDPDAYIAHFEKLIAQAKAEKEHRTRELEGKYAEKAETIETPKPETETVKPETPEKKK